MEDIKQFIIENIENKKQEKIKEYDNMISQISNEDNKVNIYYLLAKTFHNTVFQGELGIKYLQSILTNDFFKTANVKNSVNYIVFSNEDFDVMFSKTLSKEIKIIYKNAYSSPTYYISVNPITVKLADLIEIYLNDKTFKNFKKLVGCNCCRVKKNLINKIIGYVDTYKRCNKKLLDEIRRRQEEERIRKLKYEKQLEEFNEQQDYAKNFILGLTDLKIFVNEDWYIVTFGIADKNGHTGHNTFTYENK